MMESNKGISEGIFFGYVAIANRGEKGYVGGYLCVDQRGAPIEFWHTTDSPIKATRIQELLYGKALLPELLGKNIAGSLLGGDQGKSREKPMLLFTLDESILRGFDLHGIAVAFIDSAIDTTIDLNNEFACRKIHTASGDVVMRWNHENTVDVESIIPILKNVDVKEPFERIRMLLDEIGSQT